MFLCKFCEISNNTFFTEHVWTAASISANVVQINAIRLKLCGNCVFPQNFYTREIDEILVFYAVDIHDINILIFLCRSQCRHEHKFRHSFIKSLLKLWFWYRIDVIDFPWLSFLEDSFPGNGGGVEVKRDNFLVPSYSFVNALLCCTCIKWSEMYCTMLKSMFPPSMEVLSKS